MKGKELGLVNEKILLDYHEVDVQTLPNGRVIQIYGSNIPLGVLLVTIIESSISTSVLEGKMLNLIDNSWVIAER